MKPVKISDSLHKKLKTEAARLGVSLQDLIETLIRKGGEK